MTFAVIAAIALLLVGDAVIRGSWATAVRLGGPATLVVWAAWLILFRPSIRIQDDRAVIVNVGRIIEVPWARVVDIRRKLQLVFELDNGRALEAWGSPFTSKRSARGEPVVDAALATVRATWMSWSGVSDGTVARRPDIVALAIGAAALIAASLSLTMAGRL